MFDDNLLKMFVNEEMKVKPKGINLGINPMSPNKENVDTTP